MNTRSQRFRVAARRGDVLKGCLIALAVVLVIVIAIGVFVAMNFKNWAASGVAAGMGALVDASRMPADEKPEVRGIIDQIRDEYKAGAITTEEIGRIFETFEANAAFPVGELQYFASAYLEPSALPEEEKIDALLALNRAQQAFASGGASYAQLEAVIAPVVTTDANGEKTWTDPAQATDEQIAQVVQNARDLADQTGVPGEPAELDVSDLFRQHVETSLGRPIGGSASPALPPADASGDAEPSDQPAE